MAQIGPKEARRRELREANHPGIPPFLKRGDPACPVGKQKAAAPKAAAKPTTPAPAPTAPVEPETETAMRTKTKNRGRSASAKLAKARTPAKAKAKTDATSKTSIVVNLLTREGGCTTKDVLEATGWPTVSMPAMAASCGLVLTKTKGKDDKVTRYTGKAKAKSA